MKKVALIQNRLQPGGRLQVMLSMIKVLNDLNIVPDVLTLTANIKQENLARLYGTEPLRFTIKEIGFDFKMPFEWNILYFNLVVNRYLKSYDLIINHNNTSYLLNSSINLISYVHFSRKARNLSKLNSIHFPEDKKKSILDLKKDPLRVASLLYRFDNRIVDKNLQVANSNFSKEYILKYYPDLRDVQVLYPPVNLTFTSKPKEPNTVVSLGRFARDKRQLEQIKIAEKLPEFKFDIVGFVNERKYFSECIKYIKKNKIKNVYLHSNLQKNEVHEILGKAEFFIHSLRNEPFGITTVQGIESSCIPIVHNSGGQLEVVPMDELRYESMEEAVNKFRRLGKRNESEKKKIVRSLQKYIQTFDSEEFCKKFKIILNEKLK